MRTLSTLLALCEANSPVEMESLQKGMPCFDVFVMCFWINVNEFLNGRIAFDLKPMAPMCRHNYAFAEQFSGAPGFIATALLLTLCQWNKI